MKKAKSTSILCIFCLLIAGCNSNAPAVETTIPKTETSPTQILFDDFSYTTTDEMTANGWIVRSGQGWPGVTGAAFRAENVTFVDYPDPAGNRLLRMTSSTDGSSENTFQTQICHQRKYLNGTYAARIRFSDTPAAGNDGDQVSASRGVRAGGVLVYATCSSEPEENDNVVDAFLDRHPGFTLEDPRAGGAALPAGVAACLDGRGCLRTLPHRHALEAFFAARLRRRS